MVTHLERSWDSTRKPNLYSRCMLRVWRVEAYRFFSTRLTCMPKLLSDGIREIRRSGDWLTFGVWGRKTSQHMYILKLTVSVCMYVHLHVCYPTRKKTWGVETLNFPCLLNFHRERFLSFDDVLHLSEVPVFEMPYKDMFQFHFITSRIPKQKYNALIEGV